MEINIEINEALVFLLEKEYFKTFEVINGLNQNPNGDNFYSWLHKRNLISLENLKDIHKEIDSFKD